jgi:acyl carrier protein
MSMSLHRSTACDRADDVQAAADGVWSFGEFWARVSDAVGVDPAGIDPRASLRDDLDFDSLHMFELVVFMDELGCELPEGLIPVLETPVNLYDHYVTRTTAEAPRGTP